MIWLALWCASGATVGWGLGARTGRPGIGTVLGTFAGPFGWLMLLGAERVPPACPASAATAETASSASDELVEAGAPQWLSWSASA
jgi:hypothetical protein